MGPRAAAETAFLVLGVYLMATAIPMLVVALAGALMTDSDAGGVLPWLGSIGYAATALVGAGVVAFRTILVDLLTIAPSEDHGPVRPAVQAAAFSVIGLFFFASGASGLLKQVGLALFPSSQFGGATWQNTVGPLAELLVGLVLFLGSRGLVGLWGATRALGRHLPAEDAPDVSRSRPNS